MSTFQIVLLSVLALCFVGAALIFSGLIPGLKGSGANEGGTVVLWGTLPQASVAGLVDEFNRDNRPIVLQYVEKGQVVFDRDLVEALASGTGPDLILLSNDLIYRHASKVYTISYASLPQRDFKDTYVEEAELFLAPEGVIALPLTLDPMVMYWNRDMLTNAGIPVPPKTWEELLAIAPKLTQKDGGGNLIQSAVAFGEYGNVSHAKDIVSMLFMQAGSPIVERTPSGYQSALGNTFQFSLRPTDEALRYFTNFSNPVQAAYSWDKSLPNSRDAFLAGRLAFYLGYASEIVGLRSLNPHLNFDVMRVPQVKGTAKVMTIGKMTGIAIMKASKNPQLAFETARRLSGRDFSLKVAQALLLPPPRRDLLAAKPPDAYMNVFFDSALIAKSWIDPLPASTSEIFREMIDTVVSGRMRVSEAIMDADSQLNRLFTN